MLHKIEEEIIEETKWILFIYCFNLTFNLLLYRSYNLNLEKAKFYLKLKRYTATEFKNNYDKIYRKIWTFWLSL